MKKITENIPKEKICQLLKKVRLDLGYKNLDKFAKILGVKAGTYYNYEKDRLPPTELLFLLKEKFPHHVKIDAIFDLSETTELNQKPKCIHSRASDKESRKEDVLANFSDKKSARECLENLAEIDRMNPNGLKEINFIIHTFLGGMRTQKKTGT